MPYYFPLCLTILSNLLYHLLLKLTPGNIHPLFALAVTYATAFTATVAIYPLYPHTVPWFDNFKILNWSSFALGLAIVGLEVGFLLAYRLGWQISLAGMISNTAVALLLVPLGMLFFAETLSSANMIGFILCLAGLFLVNYRG